MIKNSSYSEVRDYGKAKEPIYKLANRYISGGAYVITVCV